MIKLVIFDVDGVIFDSEQIHYEVEAETLRKLGIPATGELTKEYSGTRLDKEFAAIAKRFNKKISFPQAVKVRDKILKVAIKNGFPQAPYIEETLKELSKNYTLAIATSGERRFIGQELKKTGLLKYFKLAIFGEDIKEPKPAPDAFLLPAKKLNVNPSESAVIEDSINGFKAAKAAGMTLIARKAEHNANIDFSLADYVIEDLREMVKIIKHL